MSDQAHGLRVLADQVRGDHPVAAGNSHSPTISSGPMGALPPILPPAETAASSNPTQQVAPNALLHRLRTRPAPAGHARVLAVTSGKGGVGKSNFSANLSVVLGRRGERVIMLDADMGLANAHILLGVSPPYTLEHVMQGQKTVAEVVHPVGDNVQLIAGGSGIAELANLRSGTREALLAGLRELDTTCDLIVIDTGAGVANNVMGFLCAVNEVIVVTTPEPTAITNAYATIKIVSQENPGARLMLVVNMVHSSGEGSSVADRLRAITRQFLDLDVEYLGCIPIDPAVPKAVRLRTPFVSNTPGCSAAGGVNQIIGKLGYSRYDADSQSGVDGFVNRMQRFFGMRPTM